MGRTGFGAVYCSVLQCAAMCCRALQCAAMCCSTLQCATVLQREVHFGKDWVCHSVLQCVAVCCSVLQCYSVRCFLGRTSNSFREITRFTPRIFKSRYLQIYTLDLYQLGTISQRANRRGWPLYYYSIA